MRLLISFNDRDNNIFYLIGMKFLKVIEFLSILLQIDLVEIYEFYIVITIVFEGLRNEISRNCCINSGIKEEVSRGFCRHNRHIMVYCRLLIISPEDTMASPLPFSSRLRYWDNLNRKIFSRLQSQLSLALWSFAV